jgi:uncharacterized alkaline shock family protein YloU
MYLQKLYFKKLILIFFIIISYYCYFSNLSGTNVSFAIGKQNWPLTLKISEKDTVVDIKNKIERLTDLSVNTLKIFLHQTELKDENKFLKELNLSKDNKKTTNKEPIHVSVTPIQEAKKPEELKNKQDLTHTIPESLFFQFCDQINDELNNTQKEMRENLEETHKVNVQLLNLTVEKIKKNLAPEISALYSH